MNHKPKNAAEEAKCSQDSVPRPAIRARGWVKACAATEALETSAGWDHVAGRTVLIRILL